jgi:hypothetical protein
MMHAMADAKNLDSFNNNSLLMAGNNFNNLKSIPTGKGAEHLANSNVNVLTDTNWEYETCIMMGIPMRVNTKKYL